LSVSEKSRKSKREEVANKQSVLLKLGCGLSQKVPDEYNRKGKDKDKRDDHYGG